MSHPSQTEGDLTQRLVKAGEMLRTLTPPTFISLFLIADDEVDTQTEVGEKIGRTRPTVSKYLRSLKKLPIPLATNPGQHYTVTDDGEKVITFIYDMIDTLGTDLHSVDWSDNEVRENIATFFTPLHNSRSTLPFFILHSIGSRSAVGDRITRHDPLQPVQMWDVISDVEARQEKRDKSVSVKQIRQTLWRFDDADTIEFDGEQIRLEEKGREQAFLLEQLVQMLEEQRKTDMAEDVNESTSSSQLSPADELRSSSSDTQTILPESSVDLYGSDNLAQQDNPRGFLDSGRASLDNSQNSLHESPTILPTYCLSPSVTEEISLVEDEDSSEGLDSQPQLPPVLPLTTLTLDELAGQIDRLIDEYDGDIEVKPYWTLQTDTGQYPLAPAQFSLDDAYRRAWDLINDAHELWNNRSEDTSSTE
jgi:biotin operon repressor